MGDKTYLAGDNLTYIDFFFFEMLLVIEFFSEGESNTTHPNLAAYCERMSNLPNLKEYMETSSCVRDLPFNMRNAKNNKNWPPV